MDSIDRSQSMRRVRIRYELARLRRALLAVAPFVLVVAVALRLTHRPSSTLWFGGLTVAISTAMLWYGRDWQRAVLPGAVAGLFPLALSLFANGVHGCGAGSCSSLCVPACSLGGIVAGVAIAGVANRRRAGVWFWLSASGIALLTGSMGCACIGSTGVVVLAVGFAAGAMPGLVRWAFGRRAT